MSEEPSSSNIVDHALCDLIATVLPILLLRQHEFVKTARLSPEHHRSKNPTRAPQPPLMLQPVIDFLQYQVFLKRVRKELMQAIQKLRENGIGVDLRLEGVNSSASTKLDLLLDGKEPLGGEAILRINNRYVKVHRVMQRRPTVLPQAFCPLHLHFAIESNSTSPPVNGLNSLHTTAYTTSRG
jgi:hypothetical protein